MRGAAVRGDDLATARSAVARGDWHGALDALRAVANDDPEATPERLELRASAAYGTGDHEGAVSAWEEVHAWHLTRGEPVSAARAAAMVAMYLMMDTGLMAPVRGWLRRVDRLLLDQEEGAAHALLAMVRAYERFMCGDQEGAGGWARRAVEVGERHDVAAAVALGRVAGARLRIFDGDVDGGLEELDEVAVGLMARELDPLTTGMVYCELICAMQGLALYDRAEEWTAAMDAWRVRGDFFGGINGRCRVHRAEMLRLRGSCADAEEEALRACDELRPWMRREYGWPLTELGTIRLRRGDLDGAHEAFLAAHAGGWDPEPGLALLHLRRGEVAVAAARIADALSRPSRLPSKERPPNLALTRAPLLDAQVEIAAADDDLPTARRAAEELASTAGSYPSTALRAVAELARGRVALLAGEASEGADACRSAVGLWCDVGAPYEAAHARFALASALRRLGAQDLAEVEEQVARAALATLGAAPSPPPPPPPTADVGAPDATPTPRGRRAAGAGDVEASGPTTGVFHAAAGIRTVVFDGVQVRLRDLKGMRYLERLLADPEREFHVLDLVATERGSGPTLRARPGHHELALGGEDAGPALDDQARRAYRRRLAEIEDDIAAAEADGDGERAALAAADREFIVAELASAFGLGGRARPALATAERARGSVTRAVRYALDRLRAEHRPLGEHLDRTVRTGIYCSYDPDPRVPLRWETRREHP